MKMQKGNDGRQSASRNKKGKEKKKEKEKEMGEKREENKRKVIEKTMKTTAEPNEFMIRVKKKNVV